MTSYVPQKGDFIAITFDPQSGHEQKGRRPALVVSNNLFNKHTGLAIVCPITNTRPTFPAPPPRPPPRSAFAGGGARGAGRREGAPGGGGRGRGPTRPPFLGARRPGP